MISSVDYHGFLECGDSDLTVTMDVTAPFDGDCDDGMSLSHIIHVRIRISFPFVVNMYP